MKRRPAGDLVFFIDRSLGGRLVAQALRDADARVEYTTITFPKTPRMSIG